MKEHVTQSHRTRWCSSIVYETTLNSLVLCCCGLLTGFVDCKHRRKSKLSSNCRNDEWAQCKLDEFKCINAAIDALCVPVYAWSVYPPFPAGCQTFTIFLIIYLFTSPTDRWREVRFLIAFVRGVTWKIMNFRGKFLKWYKKQLITFWWWSWSVSRIL